MFLEPGFKGQRSGWIEVICGSMFSGKTEELIRRLKRARIANQKIQIFKPAKDTRYHLEDVVSHDENSIKSLPVATSLDILKNLEEVNVVGIDEAQFSTNACRKFVKTGHQEHTGYRSRTGHGLQRHSIWPHTSPAFSSGIHHQSTRYLPHCGNLATHSYRLSKDEGQVVWVKKDKYEPRCRICYEMGNILDLRINE